MTKGGLPTPRKTSEGVIRGNKESIRTLVRYFAKNRYLGQFEKVGKSGHFRTLEAKLGYRVRKRSLFKSEI
jgi:hypothetical protein